MYWSSRFEQGAPIPRRQLAQLLRSKVEDNENYSRRLHIMLCGGETLEYLKYKDGELSLLNLAEAERWPELVCDEVYALCHERFTKCS